VRAHPAAAAHRACLRRPTTSPPWMPSPNGSAYITG
jgi:hypothetical protein